MSRVSALLLVSCLALLAVAACAQQEWVQPSFIEEEPTQPRVWQQSTAEHLGPVTSLSVSEEAQPRSLVSTESSVAVSAEAQASALLAATVTAEGKTHAELLAEIEARAPSLWANFKAKFKKVYKDEKAVFATFTKNLLRIAALNAKVAASKVPKAIRAIFSQDSAHADLSEADFRRMLGVAPGTKTPNIPVAPKAPRRAIAGKAASKIRKVFLELEAEIEADAAADADADAEAEMETEAAQEPKVVVTADAVSNLATSVKADAAAAAAGTVPPVDCDWRSKSSEIRNQGQCGSCWAHSAAATLETAFAIKTGQKVTLSPQQVLDCDPISKGCGGGQAINALKWWAANGGAASDRKIEYWGRAQGKCILTKDAKAGGLSGLFGGNKPDPVPVPVDVAQAIPWTWAGNPDENELGHQLSSTGVLSVNVDASHLQFYRSGVIDATSGCQSNAFAINHAVNLEGLGTDPVSKTRYWIVRNSWGIQWGENGRFRLLFGANTCAVANQPVKTSVVQLDTTAPAATK